MLTLVHVLKNIHEGQYISAVYLLKYPALVHVLKNIYGSGYISKYIDSHVLKTYISLQKYPALVHVLKNIYDRYI